MADEVVPPWDSESIPRSAELYMRIHSANYRNKEIFDGAFKNHADKDNPKSIPGMSTDWAQYGCPSQTRNSAPSPEKYAVVSFIAEDVLSIRSQSIVHSPVWAMDGVKSKGDNRAHTDVRGPKSEIEFDPEISVQEKRIAAKAIKDQFRKYLSWRLDFNGDEISSAP